MNVKMIRYIISKMMGVEGLLMLLPMMVGIIYGEHTSVYFLITAAILTAIAVWQKMPGEHDDLCQRRSDHCCNGLDFLVTCRCTSICTQ